MKNVVFVTYSAFWQHGAGFWARTRAPHPPQRGPYEPRAEVRSIGFVASRWIANVDGLNWFLNNVWPSIHRPGLSLDVYGYIFQAFGDCDVAGVRFHGFAPNFKAV